MTKRAEFSKRVKLDAWARSGERCECYRLKNPTCNREKIIGTPEYHHIVEASVGGSNDLDNCLVMSKRCHRFLTETVTIPEVAKSVRIYEKRAGARTSQTMPGSRKSGWKKRMDGSVVRR